MDIRDRARLKEAARQALDKAPGHRKLVLISLGALFAANILVELLGLVLNAQMSDTGGLAGMESDTMLMSLSSLLSFAVRFVTPFWSAGLVYAMLCISRHADASTATLTAGFRRFVPIFKLHILEGLLYVAAAFITLYAGLMLVSFTPLADPLLRAVDSLYAEGTVLDPAGMSMAQMEHALSVLIVPMLPILLICGALCLAVLLPLSYRLRLSMYRVLDDPNGGTRNALRTSNRLMRGNCFAMFKLDLSLLWFYLLQLTAALLPALWSDGGLFATAISMGLQLLVYWWMGSYVEVTYAKAYQALAETEE